MQAVFSKSIENVQNHVVYPTPKVTDARYFRFSGTRTNSPNSFNKISHFPQQYNNQLNQFESFCCLPATPGLHPKYFHSLERLCENDSQTHVIYEIHCKAFDCRIIFVLQ